MKNQTNRQKSQNNKTEETKQQTGSSYSRSQMEEIRILLHSIEEDNR